MLSSRVAQFCAGALVGGLLAGVPASARSAEAAVTRVEIPGLRGVASVVRDVDGVPHLKALNQHDLFFLQGWVHADDRLFQMDVIRGRGAGTLAELLGGVPGVPRAVARMAAGYLERAEQAPLIAEALNPHGRSGRIRGT